MKKFLSLVLALVMTMSLVTVSAGAKDFADSDKITYVEAVDVLSTLGVLEGDAAGFRPTDTLKRSEAAKIICALNLTPKTAAKLSADSAPFADVAKSHWAAGYIAEGVASGIIAGVGGGKFAPDAELTGYAFLKMLLVSLGYDASIENLTGANWSINVAKLADELELTKGNDNFVGSAAVTREEAALYALNTLKANTVSYANKGTQITVDGVVISTGASAAVEGKTYMAENYKKLEVDTEDYDAVGRPSITWTYDNEEIGTYASEADYVLVAKKATSMAKLLEDNNLEKKVTSFEEVALETGDVVELWVSKKAVTDIAVYGYETVVVEDVEEVDAEDELAEENGVGVIYTLASEDADLGDTDYVDTLTEKKTGYKAIGEFEKDDVLLVLVNENDDVVKFLGLAESVKGIIEKTGSNYIKLEDGDKYTIVAGAAAPNYEDTWTYYLDANGIIIAGEKFEEAEADYEFVYVLKAQAKNDAADLFSEKEQVAKIKVMYLDGDVEVLNYALSTDKKTDEVSFKVGSTKYEFTAAKFENTIEESWYAYSLNDDGEVTLKSAYKKDKSAVKDVSVEKNDKTVDTGLYASTTTTVTILNKDGVLKTYKGYKNFPSTALTGEALVIMNKTAAKELYIYDSTGKEDAETIDVAMFVKTDGANKDGTFATFYINGEKSDEYVVANMPAAKAGQLFEIEVDEDGIATIKALTGLTTGEVNVVSEDYIVVDGAEITVADDCAIYKVAKEGKSLSTGAELAVEDDVVVIKNSDGKAVEIFIYKDITILG